MRRLAVFVAAVLALPATARAQQPYAAVLLKYLTGDSEAALTELAALPTPEVDAGVAAFDDTRAPFVLTGAAAMHTEAAFRRGGGLMSEYHLHLATAIVEFGEPPGGKSNAPRAIHPRFALPVSDEFRRLWYCAVINGLEGAASVPRATAYVDRALTLYPDNAELQLLAGVVQEMTASARTSNVSPGDRRRALERAERHFRNVVHAEPDRLEAQLRLGRVLQQRERFDEARPLLAPLTDSADDRIAYLASLFLGGVEDHDRHDDKAVALYLRAVSRVPSAQTARLAASEIVHRGDDRRLAADAIPAAAGPANTNDPWWTYIFGEYWRIDLLRDALRQMRRATA